MPSRINIGPENGPYVGINEENGNLQLEDNSGNVVAEWDETNAQWDFANNTLDNVDALNSNSVNTEILERDSESLDRHLTLLDTFEYTDESSVVFDDFAEFDKYVVNVEWRFSGQDSTIFGMRVNGFDDGDYVHWDESGTTNTGNDEWMLVELGSSAGFHGDVLIHGGNIVDFPGMTNLIKPNRADRIDGFSQRGGGQGFDINAGQITEIELMWDQNDGEEEIENGEVKLYGVVG